MNVIEIKIVSAPKGRTPKEKRQGWVGLRLTGAAYEPGMLADEAPKGFQGCVVLINDAISALANHDKEAFLWWNNWRDSCRSSDVFLFEDTCYRVVNPARRNAEFMRAFRSGPLEELVDYIMKH